MYRANTSNGISMGSVPRSANGAYTPHQTHLLGLPNPQTPTFGTPSSVSGASPMGPGLGFSHGPLSTVVPTCNVAQKVKTLDPCTLRNEEHVRTFLVFMRKIKDSVPITIPSINKLLNERQKNGYTLDEISSPCHLFHSHFFAGINASPVVAISRTVEFNHVSTPNIFDQGAHAQFIPGTNLYLASCRTTIEENDQRKECIQLYAAWGSLDGDSRLYVVHPKTHKPVLYGMTILRIGMLTQRTQIIKREYVYDACVDVAKQARCPPIQAQLILDGPVRLIQPSEHGRVVSSSDDKPLDYGGSFMLEYDTHALKSIAEAFAPSDTDSNAFGLFLLKSSEDTKTLIEDAVKTFFDNLRIEQLMSLGKPSMYLEKLKKERETMLEKHEDIKNQLQTYFKNTSVGESSSSEESEVPYLSSYYGTGVSF